MNGVVTDSPLGYAIGISGEMMLSSYFVLEFQPAAVYSTYRIVFDYKPDVMDEERNVELTTVTLPINLNYRMSNLNWKPVIGAGIGYNLRLARGGSDDGFISAEASIGLEKRFGKVAIEPELQYSAGLRNIWHGSSYRHRKTIESLKLHTISMVMNIKTF